MQVKPGVRLRSAVCSGQVIIVRAPAGEIDLRCGGQPMVSGDIGPADPAPIDPDQRGDMLIGKRYANDELGLELLVTHSGEGLLSVGDEVLALKGAKPLPSSD